MFAVLTAARSREVFGATRDEIDLDAGVWTVPPNPVKMARPHHVPLFGPAVDILRGQLAARGKNRTYSQARVLVSRSASWRSPWPCAGLVQASSPRMRSGARSVGGGRAMIRIAMTQAAYDAIARHTAAWERRL
jgi:integrase